MPSPQKKNQAIDAIIRHAATRGVNILIDADDISEAFQLGKKFDFNAETKQLVIVTSQLDDEELNQLIPIIKTYFEKHTLILTSEQEEILQEYRAYSDINPFQESLDFFEGKIPPRDLDALKMSYFMRVKKDGGGEIDDIKQQIRGRFGPRGAYISNLCNAGFYEDMFKSKALKLSGDKFEDFYELRVGKELCALFVHSGLTINTLRDSFQEKVELCQLNGVSRFRVLGFGRRNIDLISDFLDQFQDFDWGTDINFELKIDSPGVLEYDIILL
ncbi:MAG: hypothetical protein ABI675_15425 [Chitinophagaceae bacterium]